MISLFSRRLQHPLEEAMEHDRVLLVNGARQVGKSTLLGLMHAERGGTAITLDDPSALQAARSDPTIPRC